MAVAWNKMPVIPYPNRSKRNSQDLLESDLEAGKGNPEKYSTLPDKSEDSKENNPKEKDKEEEKKDKQQEKKDKEQEKKDKEQEKKDKEQEKKDKKEQKEKEKKEKKVKVPDSPAIQEVVPDYDVDDEFNLPISMALFLLVIYMTFGAFIFTRWEDWSFFHAFYFVFISMSTIGFGDYVPEHPMYMMATFIYLMFGLALTSMCINVVQEKLSAYFEAAKLRIGNTIGLDVQALIAEDALEAGEAGEKTEMAEVHSGKRRKSKAAKTPEKLLEMEDADDEKKKKTKENEIEVKKDET